MMEIRSPQDIINLMEVCGFVPFFRNSIPGFSIEEHTPSELWFSDTQDGPWEWKGPVIRGSGCAYGKFFHNKAAFISQTWFPDFANWRRDGYDFDARYDDGLTKYQDKVIFDILANHASLLSKEWRKLTGTKKRGEFDAAVARLQMQGYAVTTDFEYQRGKDGQTYGWGVARYAVPERYFGTAFTNTVYSRKPEESKARILAHLSSLLPDTPKQKILHWLG